MTFTAFVLWLHLAAMAVWVGGLVAVPLVAVPALRSVLAPGSGSTRILAGTLRRFHRLSLELAVLLLLTGIFNLMNAGMARQFAFPPDYLRILFLKVGLFLLILGIQGWQALRLVPALTQAEEGPTSGETRLYRRFLWSSSLAAAVALGIVLLGVTLRFA